MKPDTIVMMSIDDITPYYNNPRRHDNISEVKESIRRVGFRGGIWVDPNHVIIAGHGRFMAAKELGMKEIPVTVISDLSEAEIKYLRIKDNRASDQSSWDEEAYLKEIEELRDMDFDTSDIEFEGAAIITDEVEQVVEDEEPEPPEEPTSRRGQIFRLGNHILMCGDATSPQDVKRLMDAAGIETEGGDIILTDPPYNVAIEGCTKDKLTIENDSMDDSIFIDFLSKAFVNMEHYLKKGGPFYIWHASLKASEFREAMEGSGLHVRQVLQWVKNIFVLGRQDYQWRHEPCFYGWKEGAPHYFIPIRNLSTVLEDGPLDIEKMSKKELQDTIRKMLADAPGDVIHANKPARNAEHPTMKPVKLLAEVLHNSSRPGDTVIDLFGGSGSTLVACEQMDRRCIMMEYDPRYSDVIIERYKNLTGEEAEAMK